MQTNDPRAASRPSRLLPRESTDDSSAKRDELPSFHPLAVLGIRSQLPRTAPTTEPEEPQEELQSKPIVAETESVPETAPCDQEMAAPIVAEPESMPETAPCDQETATPIVAEPEALPPCQEVTTSSAIDDALVNTLAGELATRFGDEFEARVRDLVAQRVAEMVAQRVMATMDVNSLGLQLKDQLIQPEPVAGQANVLNPADASIKKRRRGSRKT